MNHGAVGGDPRGLRGQGQRRRARAGLHGGPGGPGGARDEPPVLRRVAAATASVQRAVLAQRVAQGEARGRTTVGGCSPRRCPSASAHLSVPPRSWRAGSRPPGRRSTWWAAPCVTRCSRAREADGRRRPDDRRPARGDRAAGRGWADDVWTQGARFGTIGARKGTQVYEITTHRAEVYVPESRKPEVTFGDDIEVDLSRRDFTINALALRLPDLELIDPFDGLGDLAAGRLRTPLDPEVSFGDDPLRMLRAGALRGPLLPRARPGADGRGGAHARAPLHRLGRADPRRAGQDGHDRRAVGRPVVRGAHRPRRGLPARAAGPGARAGPDPPAQGRAGAHARGRRQDLARTACCAWPPSSTTSASPGHAPSPTAA